jgi:hypothetical protein
MKLLLSHISLSAGCETLCFIVGLTDNLASEIFLSSPTNYQQLRPKLKRLIGSIGFMA